VLPVVAVCYGLEAGMNTASSRARHGGRVAATLFIAVVACAGTRPEPAPPPPTVRRAAPSAPSSSARAEVAPPPPDLRDRLEILDAKHDALEGVPGMPNLRELHVEGSDSWLDVRPLSRFPSLRVLRTDLKVNLADLAASAPELETLACPGGALVDLEPLQKLTSFELRGCSKDGRLPTIRAPTTLTAFRVACGWLADISGLAGARSLEVVNLSETVVKSLVPLARLAAVKRLDLHQTHVASVAPLAALSNLEWLDVHQTEVETLAPVARLPRLATIDAPETLVEVRTLAGAPALESLWLPGARVTDVRPLATIKTLKELMVPARCSRADVQGLHKARPDLRILEWTDHPPGYPKDPSCF
jgi:hypothetical protein